MKIWIDLVNSPHILFFIPIIKRLENDGHKVLLTHRDFAQTAALVERHKLNSTLVGGHGGATKLGKIKNIISRTIALIQFAKGKKIDIAISHNSYFQLLAAKFLTINSVTSMDFEGTYANHLAFRLASKVIVPESFPVESLKRFGAKNYSFYTGLKEDICLADFVLSNTFKKDLFEELHLTNTSNKPLVVLRPPPTQALYHQHENSLFDVLMRKLATLDVNVVGLPRYPEQKEYMKQVMPNCTIPEKVVDGLQLVANADLVISAGGSMNREAAALGTPAITLFAAELPNVDQILVEAGKLKHFTDSKQIEELIVSIKPTCSFRENNSESIDVFMNIIN